MTRLPSDTELAYLADLQRQVQAAIRPIDDVLRSLLAQAVPPMDLVKELVENVRAVTSGVLLEFDGFRRLYAEYEALEARAAPVMGVAGWPILPSWPMTFVVDLFTAAAEDGSGGVERVLKSRYPAHDIRVLTHELRSLDLAEVRPRRGLLAQALVGHRRRLTGLTVPLLLTQIDGVARAFCDAHLSRRKERRARGKPRSQGVAQQLRQLPAHDRVYDTFVDCLSRLYTGEVLDRDAVIHGSDLDYGGERASLRLFLFFIATCEHLQEVREAMEKDHVA